MRNPVRSEADAFHIAGGCAALIAVSLAVGSLIDPLVGVALLIGAVAGAFVWDIATKDPDRRRPLHEAASEAPQRQPTTRPRVLLVANRTLHGEELRDELRRRAATEMELHIVAPILCSRTHYIASDVDSELDEARSRLSAALAWARAEGLAVTGKVGDPNAALPRDRGRAAPARRRRSDHLDVPTGQVELARDRHRRATARRARHSGHARRRRSRPRAADRPAIDTPAAKSADRGIGAGRRAGVVALLFNADEMRNVVARSAERGGPFRPLGMGQSVSAVEPPRRVPKHGCSPTSQALRASETSNATSAWLWQPAVSRTLRRRAVCARLGVPCAGGVWRRPMRLPRSSRSCQRESRARVTWPLGGTRAGACALLGQGRGGARFACRILSGRRARSACSYHRHLMCRLRRDTGAAATPGALVISARGTMSF
jgi:hypothetical protein